MNSIVILDGYTINPGDNPWTPLDQYGTLTVYDRTPPELVLERSANADMLLTSKVKLTASILAQLPKLKYISLLATGYNNIDSAEAGRLGIPVANIPAYSTESVVQTAFALLLELAVGTGRHDRAVKAGEWCQSPDHSFWKQSLIELDGLTLGIIGYGTIGRAIARVGAAFGMRIIAYAPRIPADPGPTPVTFIECDELLRQADVVSLNCPQTADNGGFINSHTLGLMKKSAYLLNLARGGLVNEADLAQALRTGSIAGAGLDVVAVEPMLPNNPLLSAPNCIITPHIAWASLAARRRLLNILVENIGSYLQGRPQNLVNRQFLTDKI
jgi:glycerate dehydrogenase